MAVLATALVISPAGAQTPTAPAPLPQQPVPYHSRHASRHFASNSTLLPFRFQTETAIRPEQPRFSPAPMPDQTIFAPAPLPESDDPKVGARFLTPKSQFRGDGFFPGTSSQTIENRNMLIAPTVTVKVPLD